MKPLSFFMKTVLAFFISIPITFLSSFIKYGDNYPDGFSYIGFPFWQEKSGGFAGIVVTDNLAFLKNFIFWFLLTFVLLFCLFYLLDKLKKS